MAADNHQQVGSPQASTTSRLRLSSHVVAALALAFGVGWVLQMVHAGAESHGIHPVTHWLRDSLLALPVAVLTARLADPLARRLLVWAGLQAGRCARRLTWALTLAVCYAAASVPGNAVHGHLFLADHDHLSAAFARHSLIDAAAVLGASVAVLLAVALVRGAPGEPPRSRVPTTARMAWRPELGRPALRRLAIAGLAVAILAPGLQTLPAPAPAEAQDASVSRPCNAETADRSYDVAAINVDIPFNRWGDVNPHGQVYVLQQDKEAVRNWYRPLAADPAADPAGNQRLRPRPLVLRANEGECVKVEFRNELNDDPGTGSGLPSNPRASMTVRGAAYGVQTANGGAIGYNDDTTVGNDPGSNTITYFWKAPDEGAYFFHDQASPAGGEADGGSLAYGLYGTLAVEPAGSRWLDPVSGKPLYDDSNAASGGARTGGTRGQSGELYIDAMIVPPGQPAFRESVQLAQDEFPVVGAMGFNYGTEQAEHRMDADNLCPDCVGEETTLSSWPYGDPALVKLASGLGPWAYEPGSDMEDCGLGAAGFDSESCWTANVTHAYANDPLKMRFGMAGVKETHVFHLHAHQWLREDAKTTGSPIDSQTFGPMEMFTADLIGGAGSTNGTVGDSIFHCHLYPHFAEGFWALLRVHDVREDGSLSTPDGLKVRAVQPLPDDADVPPQATQDNPGFPRFVPGQSGWRAPQPPLGISEGDGQAGSAPRVVAGDLLAETDTVTERLAMDRLSAGRAKPGAPFNDPCPTGAREVTYNVSAIQVDITYNEAGWHDTQGRIVVLDEDVDAVLSGAKDPEPLFVRVNAGDCVNWNLTNRLPNWFGDDAFVKRTQTNMFGQHIHLLTFDVLASDGSSNGWNYQQAAFSKQQMDYNTWTAADPDTNCRYNAAGCRVPDPGSYNPSMTSAGLDPGQTIHERWYAGSELQTAFTHDHHFAVVDQNRGQYAGLIVEPAGMDFRDPFSGEFFQPVNHAGHGKPLCGSACEGNAAGPMMDIIGPGASDDFREYGLSFQDFVSLTLPGGDPRDPSQVIGAPGAPETFPAEDPGTMAINYRNAPFVLRKNGKNGQPADPAYVFSSAVHDDPMTPLLQAYAGDPVRMRLIQGSHEEQHVFFLNGMRWRQDPHDPDSPLTNTQAVGVSEAFNFEIPPMNCGPQETCRGDYLYGSTAVDDLYSGMWGLMRVHGRQAPGLLALPDNAVPSGGDSLPSASGTPPAKAETPGNPCPTGATKRSYDVVALDTPITYNSAGDHDPYGLVYALAEDEQAIRDGKNPEPLVLRANEGDCVEVSLTNKVSQVWQDQHGQFGITDGDAPVPLEPVGGTPAGLRVSLHPQLLRYDVRGSDGATVGHNPDQTVGPGESIRYRWYADEAVGGTNLTEFGDVRGHRHHGLFAGLHVEPRGATFHDPFTGEPITTGASADIRRPDAEDFREFTTFFQDGLNLRDAAGQVIDDVEEPHPPAEEGTEPEQEEAVDAEDAGEKAFNYRSEPFRHRLGVEPLLDPAPTGDRHASVYSSHDHGDPDTPIFRAYEGDRVRMRVLQGSDKPRQHVYQLAGHAWRASPDDPQSRLVASRGGFAPSSVLNAHVRAGGAHGVDGVGDHLYGCALGFFHRSDGLWGLLRVYSQPAPGSELRPTPIGEVDDPRAGGHPILPLEVPQDTTTSGGDAAAGGGGGGAGSAPGGDGGGGAADGPSADGGAADGSSAGGGANGGSSPEGTSPDASSPGGQPPAADGSGNDDASPQEGGAAKGDIATACPPGSVPPSGFLDTAGNVHRAAIDCVVWYSVAKGRSETEYAPAKSVRRDQMASFVARTIEASGVRLPAPSDQGFTDIGGNVHADRINQLAEIGVVKGLTATSYGPDRAVQRDQMATFLVRAYEYITEETLPASRDYFVDDSGNTHERNINKVAEAGFTTGKTATTYAPKHSVRRDQMASFIARTLNRLVEGNHASTPA